MIAFLFTKSCKIVDRKNENKQTEIDGRTRRNRFNIIALKFAKRKAGNPSCRPRRSPSLLARSSLTNFPCRYSSSFGFFRTIFSHESHLGFWPVANRNQFVSVRIFARPKWIFAVLCFGSSPVIALRSRSGLLTSY